MQLIGDVVMTRVCMYVGYVVYWKSMKPAALHPVKSDLNKFCSE